MRVNDTMPPSLDTSAPDAAQAQPETIDDQDNKPQRRHRARTLSEKIERGTGLTTQEVGELLRISSDRVRELIVHGELAAVDLSDRAKLARPRYVVLPHQLEDFITGRTVVPRPKRKPRRRRQTTLVDYFPD